MKTSEIIAYVIAALIVVPISLSFFSTFHDYKEPLVISEKSIEIEIGMYESEVKKILGDNIREFDLGNIQNNHIKKIYYSDEMYNFEIIIKNGKVHSKELTKKG